MPLCDSKNISEGIRKGIERERKRVRRLWAKKSLMWIVPVCVVAIVALVLLIFGIVWYSQQRACYMVRLFPSLVTEIRIEDGQCNSDRFSMLDLSKYKNLKSVVIGNNNFYYASLELKSSLIHNE